MKKTLFLLLLLAGATLAGSAQTAKATEVYQLPPGALQALDSLFAHLRAAGLYNGNILVAAGGRKVRSASIGYSNLKDKTPLTESSVFELASVSKQFTAVGVLTLVQAGKIKLDQTVETILPGFPYKGITVRHLLNHTGGLPDYMALFEEQWDKSRIAVTKDVIALLQKHQPAVLFAPGERWEYSNTGYAVLAAMIEQVSGKSFAGYMQEAVFRPLGMKQTFIYSRRLAPKNIPGYAYGYVSDSAGMHRLPDELPAYAMVRYLDGIQGDGTVNTDVTDLLVWNNAVHDGRLLPAALWKEALTPAVLKDGKSTGYGFGWMVSEHPERGKAIRHSGGWPGYRTFCVHYLDKDITFIFLGNREQNAALTERMYEAVRNIIFGKPWKLPALPEEKKVATIDKGVYARYTGTYVSEEMDGFALSVTTADGQLFVQATGQRQIELLPESEVRFFVPQLPIEVEFKTEAGGQVNELVLHQNGMHSFKRKKG